jgi:cobalt-zinc-cadmium efflux system membrane fusion protein
MSVRIYVHAYPAQSFRGRIARLEEVLDAATRTVRVRIDVPNQSALLRPEMYATAEIDLGSSQTGIFVPQEAVQDVRGKPVVFVRNATETFEVRLVQTGRDLAGAVEITHGIRPGEEVATKGTFILKSEFLKSSLTEE